MEIFLYAFSVMYTPGPVNFIALNAGLAGRAGRSLGFFVGVGAALLVLFLLLGYTGEAVISPSVLPYISLVGGVYTLYLAWQICTAQPVAASQLDESPRGLGFWNGFVIQLFNPKSIMVVLPITSIMLPAAHVSGGAMAGVSLLLATLGGAAPGVYSVLGATLGRRITQASWFTLFNRLMGVALVVCAGFMLRAFYLHIVAR